jgi:hypothetical protein
MAPMLFPAIEGAVKIRGKIFLAEFERVNMAKVGGGEVINLSNKMPSRV